MKPTAAPRTVNWSADERTRQAIERQAIKRS
jgi:hypothetical protein